MFSLRAKWGNSKLNRHFINARLAAAAGRSLLAACLLAGVASPAIVGETAAAHQVACTPGYSPCIANKASDVDCYSGSGNGPRYTKPGVVYTVKRGYDRYGLDADHDGKGCER